MSLAMKPACQQCGVVLATSREAYICSHECTFCPDCTDGFDDACPNCGGELVRRPRRAADDRRTPFLRSEEGGPVAVLVIGWFLAVAYGLSAPVVAWLEWDRQLLSERFDLPPWVLYATCAVQFAAAQVIRDRRFALVAAAALTATTIGAFVSHLRIDSPETSGAAAFFTVVQVAYLLHAWRTLRTSPHGPGADGGPQSPP